MRVDTRTVYVCDVCNAQIDVPLSFPSAEHLTLTANGWRVVPQPPMGADRHLCPVHAPMAATP